jgi:hypothetical protein
MKVRASAKATKVRLYCKLTFLFHKCIEGFREALDYLDENSIINFEDFDEDSDGSIDSITFLHSGYGAEWGNSDCFGQARENRIWSHKWKIWSDSSGANRGPWRSQVRENESQISTTFRGKTTHESFLTSWTSPSRRMARSPSQTIISALRFGVLVTQILDAWVCEYEALSNFFYHFPAYTTS